MSLPRPQKRRPERVILSALERAVARVCLKTVGGTARTLEWRGTFVSLEYVRLMERPEHSVFDLQRQRLRLVGLGGMDA
jgi:hypothetical protein